MCPSCHRTKCHWLFTPVCWPISWLKPSNCIMKWIDAVMLAGVSVCVTIVESPMMSWKQAYPHITWLIDQLTHLLNSKTSEMSFIFKGFFIVCLVIPTLCVCVWKRERNNVLCYLVFVVFLKQSLHIISGDWRWTDRMIPHMVDPLLHRLHTHTHTHTRDDILGMQLMLSYKHYPWSMCTSVHLYYANWNSKPLLRSRLLMRDSREIVFFFSVLKFNSKCDRRLRKAIPLVCHAPNTH